MAAKVYHLVLPCKLTLNILDGYLGRAIASVVLLVVDNAELSGRNSVDIVIGVYECCPFGLNLKMCSMKLGRVPNLEGYRCCMCFGCDS